MTNLSSPRPAGSRAGHRQARPVRSSIPSRRSTSPMSSASSIATDRPTTSSSPRERSPTRTRSPAPKKSDGGFAVEAGDHDLLVQEAVLLRLVGACMAPVAGQCTSAGSLASRRLLRGGGGARPLPGCRPRPPSPLPGRRAWPRSGIGNRDFWCTTLRSVTKVLRVRLTPGDPNRIGRGVASFRIHDWPFGGAPGRAAA